MKRSNANFPLYLEQIKINIPLPKYNIHLNDTTNEHCRINETNILSNRANIVLYKSPKTINVNRLRNLPLSDDVVW